LAPELKLIESLWDVLEETLQRAGLLRCQYEILTNKCFGQDLVLTMQESSSL